MKKINLILAFLMASFTFLAQDTINVIKNAPESVLVVKNHIVVANVSLVNDTTFTVPHPSYQNDSILVVTVTKRILTVVTQSIDNPIVTSLLDEKALGGVIVLVVSLIHRWFTVRRWRKKGILNTK